MNYQIYAKLLLGMLLPVLLPAAHAYDRELTIYVDAGRKECFYHQVSKGEIIDIEYQVIDGGHGDLDISFSLADPIGILMVTDYKKPENIHRYAAAKLGDYRFCFDNTFSTFNRKTVFFELIVESERTEANKNQWLALQNADNYDMTMQDIMEYVDRIRNNMSKARQIQDMLRSNEARDRNLAEANYHKVNMWSWCQVIAMIIVGLLQVIMVRTFFETDARIQKFWDMLGM